MLSIDPSATFVDQDPSSSLNAHIGVVSAALPEPGKGFAQRTGRGVYTLHMAPPPPNHNGAVIEVLYRNGETIVTVPERGKGTGHGE